MYFKKALNYFKLILLSAELEDNVLKENSYISYVI